MESETTTRSESLATYRDIPQDRQHPAPRPIRTSRLDARATGRFFTLPQGGSLRRNDEAGRAAFSARWVKKSSAMESDAGKDPPRSFLATLPRGG
jgi:hypothetical protein